ncbi:MAG: hypothetical protein GON13_02010 [Nanoarchaeota archaeon]|nr:hypothetical protein [Nanoarchaeota archaeon]
MKKKKNLFQFKSKQISFDLTKELMNLFFEHAKKHDLLFIKEYSLNE